MHELSMADALVKQVVDIMHREHAESVVSITVDMGALSGVDRESFEFAFPLAVKGTEVAGALLVVEETPAAVDCDDCGARSSFDLMAVGCSKCRSPRVRITAGRDFLIKQVQLRCRDEVANAAEKGAEGHV